MNERQMKRFEALTREDWREKRGQVVPSFFLQ